MHRLVKLVEEDIIRKHGAQILYKRDLWYFSWIDSNFVKKLSSKSKWLVIPWLCKWLVRFFNNYTTTINKTISKSERFDQKTLQGQILTLRHEEVHLKQGKKYSFPLFAFLYLFCPLPLGFAYFRAKFEWEAYTVQIKARMKSGYSRAEIAREIFPYFTSPDYLWMMPFEFVLNRWLDKTMKQIQDEMLPLAK